jgi:hypothetical protein
MRRFLLSIFLLWPVTVTAQVAPITATTIRTTDTSTASLCVGSAINGACAATGGIQAGPLAVGPISVGSGYLEIQSFVPGSQTNRLVNNGGTLQWSGSALALGGAVGPGTTGKLAKFTGANAVGDSICSESGTTITCVNTVSATTLTGTLSTASQTNITGLGTITTGTWGSAATKIGLASGGTNADLSGTGGTSQFLRQNTLGGTVTVVRPAVADLSDATNVALLNAGNTFTAVNQAQAPTTPTNSSSFVFTNTGGSTYVGADNSVGSNFGTGANYAGVLFTSSTGGLSIETSLGAPIRFLTTGALRWGINSAGDFTVGASAHIALSNGTPSIASGFGTGASVVGSDYAFFVLTGSSASTSGTVNLGHTFSNAPACTANPSATDMGTIAITTTTTQVVFTYTSTTSHTIIVHCFNSQ